MKQPAFLRSFLVGLGAFALMSSAAVAQDTYVWEDYGIGFTVATDMIVDGSDMDAFTAVSSDGLISISLSPWADGDYIEIDTFNGYYLVVAPSQSDAPDFMLIALLLDTESDTNLVAAIGFEDGLEDEAIAILSSLYSY